MQSPLTLHDFVLNLLSDASARAAFDVDPDGALKAAGLTGVTPADVRDVIPLVADYAPANLAGPLPAFGTSALGADRAGAGIHPLQMTVASLPGDVSLAAAGGLRVTADSGHLSGAGSFSAHAAAGGDFSAAHDLAGTLDSVGGADPVGTVTGVAHGALGGHLDGLGHDPLGTDPLGADPLGQVTGTVHSLDPGHLLHDTGLDHGLDNGLTGTVQGVAGGLADPHAATGLVHDATAPLHGVTAPLHDATAPLGLGAGGSADADQSASGHADAHLLDLPHL
jgi:hypothetical protein